MKRFCIVLVGLLVSCAAARAGGLDTDLAVNAGITTSDNLGQIGIAPLGSIQLATGNLLRLETQGLYRGIRKVESGQGFQYVGIGQLEAQVAGPLYVLGGGRFIHANGGAWTKDTADWRAGLGIRKRWIAVHIGTDRIQVHRSGELKVWALYSQDFYKRNSPNQTGITGMQLGLRYDTRGTAWGLRLEVVLDRTQYNQWRGAGFEPETGYRLTTSLGLLRRM